MNNYISNYCCSLLPSNTSSGFLVFEKLSLGWRGEVKVSKSDTE